MHSNCTCTGTYHIIVNAKTWSGSWHGLGWALLSLMILLVSFVIHITGSKVLFSLSMVLLPVTSTCLGVGRGVRAGRTCSCWLSFGRLLVGLLYCCGWSIATITICIDTSYRVIIWVCNSEWFWSYRCTVGKIRRGCDFVHWGGAWMWWYCSTEMWDIKTGRIGLRLHTGIGIGCVWIGTEGLCV